MPDQPKDQPVGGTADQPQQTQPILPPTQFLMFPEGFQVNRATSPIGDCLAITGMASGSPFGGGVEATLMVPIEQVDAFCELCKKNAAPPGPDIITASADTDLEALAREARQRSGL